MLLKSNYCSHIFRIKLNLTALLLLYIGLLYGQTPSEKKAFKEKYLTYEKYLNAYKKTVLGGERYRGYINIIRKDNKIYLDIPKAILNRDLLLTSKINNGKVEDVDKQGFFIRSNMVKLKYENENIILTMPDPKTTYRTDDILKMAMNDDHSEPISYVFKLIGHSNNINSYLINATEFFSTMNAFPPLEWKNILDINKNRTYHHSIASYPLNININSTFFYDTNKINSGNSISVTRSIILLKEKPMFPRIADSRVGYNSVKKIFYSSKTPYVEKINYIIRWNLQIGKNKIEAYKQGEIIAPLKPIVIYIDTAFPNYIKKQIKSAVSQWLIAFEESGIRSAITTRDYYLYDSFSPDDIRYTCIRMEPKMKENIKTNVIVDPRSGEIIKGDIYINPDIIDELKMQKMVQLSTLSPAARNIKITDSSLAVKMVKYVVGHEIGHLLGLKDNLKASFAIKINQLRSPKYVSINGITPSIMDIIRYNYVAQPKDGFKQFYTPKIGDYDKFAISWGYRFIFNTSAPQDEKKTLDDWVYTKNEDPKYQYKMRDSINFDPSLQSYSLGNNVVEASELGLKNLKITARNLHLWGVNEKDKNFNLLIELNCMMFNQHLIYIDHVITSIGGIYGYDVVPNDYHSVKSSPTTKKNQLEAVDFVVNHLLNDNSWILTKDIQYLLGNQQDKWLNNQAIIVNKLLAKSKILRFESNEELMGSDYTLQMYLNDLHNKLWAETIKKKNLSKFEINTLVSYAKCINDLIENSNENSHNSKAIQTNSLALLIVTKNKILESMTSIRFDETGLKSVINNTFDKK